MLAISLVDREQPCSIFRNIRVPPSSPSVLKSTISSKRSFFLQILYFTNPLLLSWMKLLLGL